MENNLYNVVRFENAYEKEWDEFIDMKSMNGTFLQTRRFLNYHPKNRFEDHSYMVFDKKKNLAAVIPACIEKVDNQKILYSHKGSTFGGIIIDSKNYKTEKIINIIDAVEKQAKCDGINKIIYKITPNPFSIVPNDLLEYALFYKGYTEDKELNFLIDYDHCKEDMIKSLAQGKRTNVHNCEKAGCILQPLNNENEIGQFYNILCENLKKYDTQPVHTLPELIDLYYNRLKDEIGFYGIYLEGKMIAGGMMFYFNKAHVAHTQYLCALSEYGTLSPMTYLYYSLMVKMKEKGYHKLTWGVATEDSGKYINMGLAKSKENYGGEYSINRIFRKELMAIEEVKTREVQYESGDRL